MQSKVGDGTTIKAVGNGQAADSAYKFRRERKRASAADRVDQVATMRRHHRAST